MNTRQALQSLRSALPEVISRKSLEFLLAAIGVIGLAVTIRLLTVSCLDLRDLPGAAAPLSISRAFFETQPHDWDVRFIQWMTMLSGRSVPDAARLVSELASVAMVIGAMLGGWALAGRAAALCVGLVAACWSLAIYPSFLVGADPAALGLSWLGVGLCWAGGRLEKPGLNLIE